MGDKSCADFTRGEWGNSVLHLYRRPAGLVSAAMRMSAKSAYRWCLLSSEVSRMSISLRISSQLPAQVMNLNSGRGIVPSLRTFLSSVPTVNARPLSRCVTSSDDTRVPSRFVNGEVVTGR